MMPREQLIEWLRQLSRHKARLMSAEKIVSQGMVSLKTLAENSQDVTLFDDASGRMYELDAADIKTLAAAGYDEFRRSVREQVARAEEGLVTAVREDSSGTIRSLLEVASAEKDYPERVRTAAVELLAERIGEAAIDECVSALGSAEESVRYRAVLVLMWVPSVRTTAPLLTALGDTDQDVRFLAATALGKKGAAEAIGPLRALAESDPAERARAAAREALHELGASPVSASQTAPAEAAPVSPLAKRWWQFWK